MRPARFLSVAVAVGLSLLLAAPGEAAPGKSGRPGPPRIADLEVDAQGDRLEVAFRVVQAFDERIQEKLDSGLEVSFHHQIEARRRRTLWFANSLAQKSVFTRAAFDKVARVYTLTLMVDGATVETRTTAEDEEMRRFMTFLQGIHLDLPDGTPRDGRNEIRVRCKVETRFFAFFPYDVKTDWASFALPDAGPASGAEGMAGRAR